MKERWALLTNQRLLSLSWQWSFSLSSGVRRGSLSPVSTIEELLEIKSSGSGLENQSSRWQHGTLYPQQLTLTSSTSRGLSVGIVRSRTQAMEFSFSSGVRHYVWVPTLMLEVACYSEMLVHTH
jgi:hypothetical protein